MPAFLKCIDYAVNLMGEDSVGFARSRDQMTGAVGYTNEFLTSPKTGRRRRVCQRKCGRLWPWSDGFKGMENHSGYPNLTRGMVGMGYSDEQI